MSDLVCHDHQMTVAQRFDIFILLAMLQTQYLFDVLNLSILTDLKSCGIADIQQLTPETWQAAAHMHMTDYGHHLYPPGPGQKSTDRYWPVMYMQVHTHQSGNKRSVIGMTVSWGTS